MINTKPAAIRSLEENGYYHGVVVVRLAKAMRLSPEYAHEWVKLTFDIQSTATLTTIEFEDLMGRVRTYAKDFMDIDIPLPNED